ncbi:hypothetical protein Drorol1_Dr00011667 [Drosera rotundifolia]
MRIMYLMKCLTGWEFGFMLFIAARVTPFVIVGIDFSKKIVRMFWDDLDIDLFMKVIPTELNCIGDWVVEATVKKKLNSRSWLKLMKFRVTQRSVRSMISMVKMPSRKEWVAVALACMIHLISSSHSLERALFVS